MKKCTCCAVTKLEEEFYKNKAQNDGLSCFCKNCVKIEGKKRYQNNKERVLEINQSWQVRNPEKYKEAHRKCVRNKPEQYKATAKKWAIKNADRVSKKRKEWVRKNPKKVKASKDRTRHKRRARLAIVEHEDYSEHLADLRDNLFFQCTYCKGIFPISMMEIDHKIPISRGGPDIKENITPACKHCNSQKNAKTPEEYKEYLKVVSY